MYTVWIKIDETLPWIELQGKYETKRDAKNTAKEILLRTEMRIVEIPERERRVEALATKH